MICHSRRRGLWESCQVHIIDQCQYSWLHLWVNLFHFSVHPINCISRQKIYPPLGNDFWYRSNFSLYILVMFATFTVTKIKEKMLEVYILHVRYCFIQISYFRLVEKINRMILWDEKTNESYSYIFLCHL